MWNLLLIEASCKEISYTYAESMHSRECGIVLWLKCGIVLWLKCGVMAKITFIILLGQKKLSTLK